jgi:hypothetical protein
VKEAKNDTSNNECIFRNVQPNVTHKVVLSVAAFSYHISGYQGAEPYDLLGCNAV